MSFLIVCLSIFHLESHFLLLRLRVRALEQLTELLLLLDELGHLLDEVWVAQQRSSLLLWRVCVEVVGTFLPCRGPSEHVLSRERLGLVVVAEVGVDVMLDGPCHDPVVELSGDLDGHVLDGSTSEWGLTFLAS